MVRVYHFDRAHMARTRAAQTGGTAMNETKLTAAVVGLTVMLAAHVQWALPKSR
jgi:hypothetical protein